LRVSNRRGVGKSRKITVIHQRAAWNIGVHKHWSVIAELFVYLDVFVSTSAVESMERLVSKITY